MSAQIRIRRHGIWPAAGAALVLGVGTTAVAAASGAFDFSGGARPAGPR